MKKGISGTAVLVCAGAIGTGLYLFNASWLARAPSGDRPSVVAQRGLHQIYGNDGVDNSTCTAVHIEPPRHAFIDNSLPSIAEAFALGADVVEVDVQVSKDQEFVLFHDYPLDCRTNGTGHVADHTLKELKRLDIGYGYTADGGVTFPLRGKGVGLMPTLEEALKAFPERRFLVQVKNPDFKVGKLLASYLEDRHVAQWDRLAFFGFESPVGWLKSMKPEARIWSGGGRPCLLGYIAFGWAGYVPKACDGGIVFIPIQQTGFIWGWPNRFLARMRRHRTEVMLVGRIDGMLSRPTFSRLDSDSELKRLPPRYDGSIWTDRIDVVGPALKGRE